MAETADSDYSAEEWLNQKLPEAVQKAIYDYLEVSDKLTLRAAFSKTQRAFVDNALQGTLDKLYVSPNKRSLRNFKLICNNEYYQQHVTHVIFVSQTIAAEDFEPLQTFKQYHAKVPKLSMKHAQQSFRIYRKFITRNESVLPWTFFSQQGPSMPLAKFLRESMANLPRLGAVSVVSDIAQDGLNGNPLWYSYDFATIKEARGHLTLQHDVASQAAAERLCWGFADRGVDAFFEAVSSADHVPSSLTLGGGMTDQLCYDIQVATEFKKATLNSIFSKVKKLSIGCNDYDEEHFSTMWKHIAESAADLEELCLYNGAAFSPEFWRTPGDGIPILDHFLYFGRFPTLKKLQLLGDHSKPGMLKAKHFKRFLNRHRKVPTIVVRDLLFTDGAGDVCKTMKSTLVWARSKISEDTTFSMKVHRRDEHHDGLCTRDGRYECDGACEIYVIEEGNWMDRSELDEVAHELRVKVVDNSWDFGSYVMRR